eukprot:c27267_g1_i1 orf=171-2165(+)
MAEPPPALSALIASYLHRCGFSKTLDAFLTESHCEFSEEQVVVELENIYNYYILTQSSGILMKKKKTKKGIPEADYSENQVNAFGLMPVLKSSQDKCKIGDNTQNTGHKVEMVTEENTKRKKKHRMESVPVVEPGLKIEVIGIPRQVVLGNEGRKLSKTIEYMSENRRKPKRKRDLEAELLKEHDRQFEVGEVQAELASQKREACVKHEGHANEAMPVQKDRQRKKMKKSKTEAAAESHKKVWNCELEAVVDPQGAAGYAYYKDDKYDMKIESLKQELADKGKLSKKWKNNEPLTEQVDNAMQNHLKQSGTGLTAEVQNKVGSGKIQAVTDTQKDLGYTDYKADKYSMKRKSVKKEKVDIPEAASTQNERHCTGKKKIEGMPEQFVDLMQDQLNGPGTDINGEQQRNIINGEIVTVADPQEQGGYTDNKEETSHGMTIRLVDGEVHNPEWIPTHNERQKRTMKKNEGMLEKHDGMSHGQSNQLHWQKENVKQGMDANSLENGVAAKKEQKDKDIGSELNQKTVANPTGSSVNIHSRVNGNEYAKQFVEKKSVAADGLAVESSFDFQKNENNKVISGKRNPSGSLAFKRVDVSKVEFADPRLQDNSYWSKDGAQEGWGAKAQSVLGLVRGKDFRHEKTKKKRGSYRGGAIDFDSHSVKFSYSDDE